VAEVSGSERSSIIIAQGGSIKFSISSSVLKPACVTSVENRGQISHF